MHDASDHPPDEARRQSAGRGNSGESSAGAEVPKVQGDLDDVLMRIIQNAESLRQKKRAQILSTDFFLQSCQASA